ncbi:cytochrome aa3 quinol oxidase subunit III [Lysinibacillus fusiformis]|jgi:cytochrome aa3-600 menaquinol oxidase subunit 3|uniref:Quinol oxidase subunit 3 n=1 Tax=Lysinibacillus fusiformis TaxID=28031 RepID=A0A1H9MNN0_9BACI|nr:MULTISPECIES: cytochrome aa3 quinol oxidase subunit III [Lysinibacillus]EAZ85546.1 cytochrome aa3 quinol oxidase subunit III [Bacillus sp. B14905]HAU32795.1 cytochrome aa3 quinol oxidase subunit III [Lysinibacillus sp.]AJK87870.1 cytochrome o ubiquinol oxidase subunit III [Lysinibacillus fusiformis]KAB0442883.1 cytochrome aa3 quinol oxidase subunit III [Lysinibacillus fusiformis]KEK13305.1 cytochrome o ubiquinol oxidase subunit III [Lysinibacillus sphaericus]
MKIDQSLPLEYSTQQNQLNILGFWVFIGAEIMLFGTLFAAYFVLVDRTGTGPTGADIFEITPVLFETFILLTSSFTIGLGIHAMRKGYMKAMITFYILTLLLGVAFIGFEVYEFIHYVHVGAGLQTSAFTATLLTTLGTHGAHVTFGVFWGIFIVYQLITRGLTPETANKSFIFSLYWHFLDVVWIFIFSFIYLKGMV